MGQSYDDKFASLRAKVRADQREELLAAEEHVRDMLEFFYEVAPSDCPYAAQVEAGLVRQREHTLKRLRDVEEELGHNGAAP